MKKFKFFFSLLKERDWLEEMAAQGWLLTGITMGVVYHFRQVEPCEKVFEVERFAITSHPTVAALTARTRAFDITSQFGWEQVTHDEDMNYYFMKDKAGDETDEFYDDPESRRERAERYRRHLSIEQPRKLLLDLMVLSVLYVVMFLLLGRDSSYGLMWFYVLYTAIEIALIHRSIVLGQTTYTELCLSREEWESYKKYSEKKHFRKVHQLRSYLQEKSGSSLSLKGHENGYYLFEEDPRRYDYFIDTKRCLKKRLKEDGLRFTDEKKDYLTQSLKWYEMSIADTAQYGLTPVAAIGRSALVYKRPCSAEPLPCENGKESLNFSAPALTAVIFFVCCAVIGFIAGFTIAMLSL